jgi:simple sugar transport system substrate-binding protein
MRGLRLRAVVLASIIIASQGVATASAAEEGATEDISVVFVTASQPNDPFWNVVKRGAEDAGADLGVDVQYIGSETFDLTRMVQNLEATIASAPSGIVVPIYDYSVLEAPIQKAIAAGIPVIEIGSAVQPPGSLVTIGSDDYEAGKIAGERAAAAGATSILCVNSEPGNVGLEERCRGMTDGAPGATVTQAGITSTDPAAFQQQLTAALKADEAIDAVITSGPVEADLALQVLADGGFADRVQLATFDLSPVVLEAIDSGSILFALDQQQYLMGYLPVVIFANQAKNLVSPVGRILTGPGVVTSDTAARIVELSAEGTR